MSETPWLSDNELVDATHRKIPSAQARALTRIGVTFHRRPDGTLLVSREAVAAALRGGAIVDTKAPANGLNWSKRA
jgi:hypothetical protein